jgi:uncharacterized protein YjbJ (UPF0337 family)
LSGRDTGNIVSLTGAPSATRSLHSFPRAVDSPFSGECRNSNRFGGENNMKPSTQNEIEGNVHDVKGKIKEKVGQLTDNPDLEDQGTVEKITGDL